MRIAQVAPLYESVPPKKYGGTERIVSYLTEELVQQGHEVFLFASPDSVTQAHRMENSFPSSRMESNSITSIAKHYVLLESVFKHREEFDLIHFHTDFLHFPWVRRERVAHLTTLHGRLDLPELRPLFLEYPEVPVISISRAQQEPLPQANWRGVVYHGLPKDLYQPNKNPKNYLAFLGRISPEKGAENAIKIAMAASLPLKIAAKIDPVDQRYFDSVIHPLLKNPGIEFVGEINDEQKQDFLGHALALLFPIQWPEPFGLVMIESMACGTPVVAFRQGSVSEIIREGVSGTILSERADIASMVLSVKKTMDLNRVYCREEFEKRFTSQQMVQNYLKIYESILQ